MIIGKWLAAMMLYGVMLLFSAINFAFLFRYGNPDWKPLAIGYLGLLLQAGGLLAIGTFISSLTKNQIIAGAATFGVCLLLWVLEWLSGYETGNLGQSARVYVRSSRISIRFPKAFSTPRTPCIIFL